MFQWSISYVHTNRRVKKIIWEEKMAISYKEAGVDKEEGYRAVELMKKAVAKTNE